MSESGAKDREGKKAGPISLSGQLEMTRLEKRKAQGRRDARSSHAKDEHGGRGNSAGYQLTVQHREDGMKEGAQQANEEP